MKRFANLEAACGGKINPDTLERFQLAMIEYKWFMEDLKQLFGPKKEEKSNG